MNNFIQGQIFASLTNLVNNISPINILIFPNILFQTTPLTILSDQIAIVSGPVDVCEHNNVWMYQSLHDFDLIIEHVSI